MDATATPAPLDLDALIARIKAEAGLADRAPLATAPLAVLTPLPSPLRLDELADRDAPSLPMLLALPDEDMVRQAYQWILRRPPDERGQADYLAFLRRGGNRLYALASMIWSAEGRQHPITVRGLGWIARLRPLPAKRLFYPLLVMLTAIHRPQARRLAPGLALRALATRLQTDQHALLAALEGRDALLASLAAQLEETNRSLQGAKEEAATALERARAEVSSTTDQAIAESIAALDAQTKDRLEQASASLSHRIYAQSTRGDELAAALAQRIDEVDAQRRGATASQDARATHLEDALRALQAHIASIEALAQGTQATAARLDAALTALTAAQADADQEAARTRERVARLTREQDLARSDLIYHRTRMHELMRALSEAAATAPPAALPLAADDGLDAYYLAFEDAFRGDSADIEAGLGHYLADLADTDTVDPATPLLDLGCGRGEWLRLLGSRGIPAEGIDTNGVMVAHCRERGLSVRQGDAVAHLRTLADGTLGALSAFHLIEHLPFAQLYALLEQAHRVLRPGGLLLLETPNPENVLVGSHTFYHDPTHRNPMTPTATCFMVRYFGFEEPRLRRLHPYPESAKVPGDDPLTARVNGHLCGPQDFALIARKPAP